MPNKLSLADRILAKSAPKPDDYEASLLSPEPPKAPQDELESILEAPKAPTATTLAERILAKKAAK